VREGRGTSARRMAGVVFSPWDVMRLRGRSSAKKADRMTEVPGLLFSVATRVRCILSIDPARLESSDMLRWETRLND